MKKMLVVLVLSLTVWLSWPALGQPWYPKEPTPAASPLITSAGMVGDGFSIVPLADLLARQTGPVTVLYYFSAVCGHCIQAGPGIARMARDLGTQGITTIGIATGRNSLLELKEYREKSGITFPVYRDSTSAFARDNNIRATPTLLLVPRTGNPEIHQGFGPGMDRYIEIRAVQMAGGPALSLLKADTYVGSRTCAACHVEEYRSWSLTHHSVAFFSLKDEQTWSRPECVSCHVTGWGKVGGYTSLAETPEQIHVGCEQCHGPAGGHGKARPVFKNEVEAYGPTCLACHDKKHSIGFTVEKGLPLAGHKINRTLPEAAWQTQRAALEKNEAARPLISFPDGKVMGNETCKGCHPTEYSQWSTTRHAGAITSLKSKGKDQDMACIGCHALLTTPEKRSDPGGWTPGVGCESCHGPAEQHVKAGGGKDNIVGLTDSCPVCVIDAMCSTCHNLANDPDFNLDRDLPRAGHKPHPAP